jgi:transcriptional regulator with XRE-family HTH domain
MSGSPFNLARWQAQHGFTYESAAKALGVCRAAYARYLKLGREGKPLPKMLVMACRFIDQEAEKKGGKK